MHYVGVTFILRHRFEITKHDRPIWALWEQVLKVENSAEFDPLYFRGSCQSRSAITGHKLAREKTARQVRSYRLHVPSSTSQNPPRALLSVPKNHAPDLERAVLPRARRIASQPQRSQIKRREPTESLCSFAAVHPGSHSTFSLTAQKSRPPIAMSPRCAEFHAIGARRARPDPFRAWR